MKKMALQLIQRLAEGGELLDVRAPIEFQSGHFPGATNLPLLNNDERAAVGTAYKQQGADAALQLGHQLVDGETRDRRLQGWINFLKDRPEAKICCFRGGLRSQLVQAELGRHGVDREIVKGGYKALRKTAVELLARVGQPLVVLGGLTGSGKTDLLKLRPHVDLEAAAEHRGSAFGARGVTPPHQAVFENRLAVDFARVMEATTPIWIEDESRTIGRLVVPSFLFERMQSAPLAVIEVPRSERARRLTQQYLSEMFSAQEGVPPTEIEVEKVRQTLHTKLLQLQKRLGGLETQKLALQLDESVRDFSVTGRFASFWTWVERLLEIYYDPMYLKHLDQNRDRIVFRGSPADWISWSSPSRV